MPSGGQSGTVGGPWKEAVEETSQGDQFIEARELRQSHKASSDYHWQ